LSFTAVRRHFLVRRSFQSAYGGAIDALLVDPVEFFWPRVSDILIRLKIRTDDVLAGIQLSLRLRLQLPHVLFFFDQVVFSIELVELGVFP
jgi:hypothetical protein